MNLNELFSEIKNALIALKEAGFDPPVLSHESSAFMRNVVLGQGKVEIFKDPEMELEKLGQEIRSCTRCPLYRTRKNPVLGEGDPRARLVFVGEAPGATEDKEGRPFVGKAGELLSRIILAMGTSREEVYICNVVKCRPPGNRDPEEKEIKACIPYLERQIKIISPDAICVMGRIAGQAIFGKSFRISRDRGKWLEYLGIPVMPTYHPAYLLRYPEKKRETWQDVQKIMKKLGLGR